MFLPWEEYKHILYRGTILIDIGQESNALEWTKFTIRKIPSLKKKKKNLSISAAYFCLYNCKLPYLSTQIQNLKELIQSPLKWTHLQFIDLDKLLLRLP